MLMLVLGMVFFSSCNEELWDDNYEDYETETESDGEFGGDDGPGLTLYKVQGASISKIKDYNVSSSLLSFQKDEATHQLMWEHVEKLIPGHYRDKIDQFEVFHSEGGLLGYVEPIDTDDLSKWKFALAIDMGGDMEKLDFRNIFTEVTLHEYGHILTLNDDQISISSESSCNSYFTGEGCSDPDSYINELFEIGWSDIIDEHDFENPEKTYEKYRSRFVSDYAATNPGEDVAEVFTFFVASSEKPNASNIANEKIRKMYETPSLMSLREQIRERVDEPTLRAIASTSRKSSFNKFRVCRHHKHSKR